MTVAEVILVLGLIWTLLALLLVLAIGIVGYRIAVLIYVPKAEARRPVPRPGQVVDRGRPNGPEITVPGVDETVPPVKGVNRYPVDRQEVPPQIGDDPTEAVMLEEREQAWHELREDGYSDEEIAEMERRSAIRVFD